MHSCKQEYVCQRLHCDHVDTRTSHEGWSSWSYLNPKSCLKERICTRCNHREEKKEHQSWTDWQYIEMDDCEQTKNCERCEEADYRTKHTYESKWDYTNANDCTVHVLCSRCRDKKILPDKEHKWVTIKHPTIPNQYRNYCQRCKAMEDVDNS